MDKAVITLGHEPELCVAELLQDAAGGASSVTALILAFRVRILVWDNYLQERCKGFRFILLAKE